LEKERIRFVMPKKLVLSDESYPEFVSQLVAMLEQARRSSARSINAFMTATYWEIGRRIVEHEQRGQKRAQEVADEARSLGEAQPPRQRTGTDRSGRYFFERAIVHRGAPMTHSCKVRAQRARITARSSLDDFSKSFAIRKKLVDVTGIEPVTPCLQSKCRNTMWLYRLAFTYVM
jgi:hypothetical protein